MRAQYVTLAFMLATVFSVSSGLIPAIYPHFGHHFGHHFGNHFGHQFGHHFPGSPFIPHFSVQEVPIPPYITRIFHSAHFPYYRPGQSFGNKNYPINYLPPYLQTNKRFGFGRYTSYLNRVFSHSKTKN